MAAEQYGLPALPTQFSMDDVKMPAVPEMPAVPTTVPSADELQARVAAALDAAKDLAVDGTQAPTLNVDRVLAAAQTLEQDALAQTEPRFCARRALHYRRCDESRWGRGHEVTLANTASGNGSVADRLLHIHGPGFASTRCSSRLLYPARRLPQGLAGRLLERKRMDEERG